MEILICEKTTINPQGVTEKGYSVTFVTRNKKKSINEQEFFVEGSEIETKIQQLRRLLKTYFDAQV